MANVGSDLQVVKGPGMWKRMMRYLQHNRSSGQAGSATGRSPALLLKYSDTAPTSNTSNHNPIGEGDICLHFGSTTGTLTDVYVCTVWASTSSFTWAKMTGG